MRETAPPNTLFASVNFKSQEKEGWMKLQKITLEEYWKKLEAFSPNLDMKKLEQNLKSSGIYLQGKTHSVGVLPIQ